jgi:transcription elongation factor GreA
MTTVVDKSEGRLTLQELGARYLASLSGELRQRHQPEVHRFIRWYGADRQAGELRGHEVSSYAETFGSSVADASERIEVVRAFLSFAKKEGCTATNLAVHLRLRKSAAPGPAGGRARARKKVSLTPEGRAALETELERLKAERPRVAEDLQRAMADKDFRENAPLDAAREQQGYLEARIREIEATLADAVLLAEEKAGGSEAEMGSTLVLRNLGSGAETCYTLVPASEANASQGRISVESPVGKALLGRTIGEEVEVTAPSSVLRFRIERIEG